MKSNHTNSMYIYIYILNLRHISILKMCCVQSNPQMFSDSAESVINGIFFRSVRPGCHVSTDQKSMIGSEVEGSINVAKPLFQ